MLQTLPSRTLADAIAPLSRVVLEMMAALKRIESGSDAQLPMWIRVMQGGSSTGEIEAPV